MADLGIIIVTHNSREFLEQCLGSLADKAISMEIIVVDNNSADGSIEFIRNQYPHIALISNPKNSGFAAANNTALRQLKSRYVLLLNPDTIVHGSALSSLVSFLNDHPSIWAAGPSIKNADGSPQRTGVRFPSNWNVLAETFFLDRIFPKSRLFGSHKELFEDAAKPRKVDYVQGSCLIVRSSILENVGLLDEQFFMYFEETDWCFRMKQAGGEVWYAPVAEITHFGGGEFAHFDERRILAYHESQMRFYRKHYSKTSDIILKFILILRSLIRLLAWTPFLFSGNSTSARARSTLRGYFKVFPLVISGRSS